MRGITNRSAVIIDTNVVVAGLLTSHKSSPVIRILDGMLTAAFSFVLSEALLAEYRTVLLRPKLRKLHGLTVDEVEIILTDLAQHAIVLRPSPTTLSAPDPGDQFLWDLLSTRPDLYLVTGDKNCFKTLACRTESYLHMSSWQISQRKAHAREKRSSPPFPLNSRQS